VLVDAEHLLHDYGVPATALDELREVVELFGDHGLERVRLTLAPGMARGIAYYSGLIFEMYARSGESTGREGAELQICGGGRYDGLAQAITQGRSLPALGFAFGVERLLHCIPPQGAEATGAPKVALVPRTSSGRRAALAMSRSLRAGGFPTVVLECGLVNGRYVERLRREGFRAVIALDPAGEVALRSAPDISLIGPDDGQVDLERLRPIVLQSLDVEARSRVSARGEEVQR
jgi:histidyl-tRNA synthetase